MDILGIILLGIASLYTTLFISMFFKNKGSNEGKVFALSLLFAGLWSLFSFINHIAAREELVRLFTRLSYATALLSIFSLLLFSESYPSPHKYFQKKLLAYSVVSLVITIITIFSPYVISEGVVRTSTNNEGAEFGMLFSVYACTLIVFLSMIIYNFLRALHTEKGAYHDQIKYILMGCGLTLVTGATTAVVLPVLGIETIGYLAPYTSIFALGFIYLSIFRYRFLDTRLFLTYGLELFVLTCIAYSFFYGIIFLDIALFDSVYAEPAIFAGIIYATIFIIIMKGVSNFIHNHYVKPYFNYENISIDFNRLLGSSLDKFKVSQLLLNFIKRHVDISEAYVLKHNHRAESEEEWELLADWNGTFDEKVLLRTQSYAELVEFLQNEHQPIIVEEVKHRKRVRATTKNLCQKLFNNGIGLIIPIVFTNRTTGFILLGLKNSGDGFSIQEIKLLENLSLIYSIALQRAMLYSDTQEFTITLQDKVNAATKELQEKYQQERDMMGIMGHELRTPISISKGMLELLISKLRNSSKIEKEYILDKSEKAFNSVIKESELIETMLSTSHVDNHKIDLQMTEVNLEEIVDYAIAAHRKDADLKGLEVSYIKPDKPVPLIVSDRNRVLEVINNLVSNAVKYTHTGHVHVFLKPAKLHVSLVVKDTGIGIPKEAMHKLGRKFYRVDQYVDNEGFVVRPGGTGLGLYVVKGILEVLGGDLRIKSKLDKGSVFTAIFPIRSKRTPQVITNEDVADDDENIDMFEKLGLKK